VTASERPVLVVPIVVLPPPVFALVRQCSRIAMQVDQTQTKPSNQVVGGVKTGAGVGLNQRPSGYEAEVLLRGINGLAISRPELWYLLWQAAIPVRWSPPESVGGRCRSVIEFLDLWMPSPARFCHFRCIARSLGPQSPPAANDNSEGVDPLGRSRVEAPLARNTIRGSWGRILSSHWRPRQRRMPRSLE